MPRVFHPVPGACKVELLGRDTTFLTPIVNVLHASCGTAPTAAQLTAVANAIKAVYLANLANWPDTYIMDSIQVTDLNSSGGPQVLVSVATAGTHGDGYPNMAACVELYTHSRGRSYRGRIYLPVAENETTPSTGETLTTYQSNMASIIAAFQTGIQGVGAGFDLVVVSRKLGLWNAVTALLVRAGIGTIRRRLFG